MNLNAASLWVIRRMAGKAGYALLVWDCACALVLLSIGVGIHFGQHSVASSKIFLGTGYVAVGCGLSFCLMRLQAIRLIWSRPAGDLASALDEVDVPGLRDHDLAHLVLWENRPGSYCGMTLLRDGPGDYRQILEWLDRVRADVKLKMLDEQLAQDSSGSGETGEPGGE